MTISQDAELQALRKIGRIVARTLQGMAKAMEPGMTTAELDDIGRAMLEREGAVSAPESLYSFPGATCISVNDAIAHGVPGPQKLAEGDLVNIDVSASLDGFFCRYRGQLLSWCGVGRYPEAVPRRSARDADRDCAGRAWQTHLRHWQCDRCVRQQARLYADPQSGQPWDWPRVARSAERNSDMAPPAAIPAACGMAWS